MKTDVQNSGMQEKEMKTLNGFLALGVWILLALGAVLAPMLWGGAGFILSILVGILLIVALPGFAIIRPNEAIVLTLFGKYVGTIKGEGFYWYNPFCVPVRHVGRRGKMSLKAMTLDNGQQKINDELGNPIIIGIVVIWRVTNTAKAAFDVDDYEAYLSTQCDSAFAASCANTLTTASTTMQKSLSKAPASKWRNACRKKFNPRWKWRAWKSSKHALPTWRMPLKSPLRCSNVNKRQPSLMLVR